MTLIKGYPMKMWTKEEWKTYRKEEYRKRVKKEEENGTLLEWRMARAEYSREYYRRNEESVKEKQTRKRREAGVMDRDTMRMLWITWHEGYTISHWGRSGVWTAWKDGEEVGRCTEGIAKTKVYINQLIKKGIWKTKQN